MRKHALEGVRVVDFSWIVAGPTCTRILADFGAEVIRVENEQAMDYIRHGLAPPGSDSPNMGGLFNNLNRNKLGVSINVMHPSGMELVHDLIAVSDIVVENFSSTVLSVGDSTTRRSARFGPTSSTSACPALGIRVATTGT